jgi:hypothetical protein
MRVVHGSSFNPGGGVVLILAIDPGCLESAYVVLKEDDLSVIESGKIENEKLLLFLTYLNTQINHIAIEMVASYGMAVGAEVFETVFWIGRFWEAAQKHRHCKLIKIYRKEEKMNLCGTMKAKDSNIIQALKDRFGDKGTKKNPGWFYGFSKDIWQAYAVGVTYYDLYLRGDKE